jgi:hypothetical protein
VTNTWDEEFGPSAGARSTLQWALEHGASTLGEAYDLLDQLEVSNDVPGSSGMATRSTAYARSSSSASP